MKQAVRQAFKRKGLLAGPTTREALAGCVALLAFVFVLNPLLGLATCTLFVLKTESRTATLTLIALLCLYMGAINTTKVPESDELNYLYFFTETPHYSFLQNLMGQGDTAQAKEFFFSIITYVSYYLLLGNKALYILMLTFFIYFFQLLAIYKMGRHYRQPVYMMVAAMVVTCFFTQYFNLTAHIIRQMLAMSMFLYSLSLQLEGRRSHWVWLVLAFFTHNAIGLLILFSIAFSYIRGRGLIVVSAVLLLGFALGVTITDVAAFLISKLGLASYAVQRVSEAVVNRDGSEELSLGFMAMVMLPMAAIALVNLLLYRDEKHGRQVSPEIFYLVLVWSLLVLSMSYAPVFQYRFFYMLYTFLPLVVVAAFRKGTWLSMAYCAAVAVFFVVRFYKTFDAITWTYAPADGVLMWPFFKLLNLSL